MSLVCKVISFMCCFHCHFHSQNLFIQSSDPSVLAQTTAEVVPEPGEKPHSLEEYSYDHFR